MGSHHPTAAIPLDGSFLRDGKQLLSNYLLKAPMGGYDSRLFSQLSSLTIPSHETVEVLVKCLKAGPLEVGREALIGTFTIP